MKCERSGRFWPKQSRVGPWRYVELARSCLWGRQCTRNSKLRSADLTSNKGESVPCDLNANAERTNASTRKIQCAVDGGMPRWNLGSGFTQLRINSELADPGRPPFQYEPANHPRVVRVRSKLWRLDLIGQEREISRPAEPAEQLSGAVSE